MKLSKSVAPFWRVPNGRVGSSTDRLAEQELMKHFSRTSMKHAGIVLLLTCASVSLASADVVGTLNIHTALDGHKTTGRDSGQPVAVQVDGFFAVLHTWGQNLLHHPHLHSVVT